MKFTIGRNYLLTHTTMAFGDGKQARAADKARTSDNDERIRESKIYS